MLKETTLKIVKHSQNILLCVIKLSEPNIKLILNKDNKLMGERIGHEKRNKMKLKEPRVVQKSALHLQIPFSWNVISNKN